MLKDKTDYKLINLALIVFIGFLVYQTKSLWFDILAKVFKIVMPFLIAFTIAYAFYPLLRYLQKKKIPKGVSVIIIIGLIIGVLSLTLGLVIPMVFNQLSSLFNGIIAFIISISKNYDLNLGPLQETLTKTFNEIISSVGNSAKDGAISAINMSLGFISVSIISFSAAVYFLIDMDKIRMYAKYYAKKSSNRNFLYIKTLDKQMLNYLSGFLKVVIVSMLEYTVAFLIIGHPNALLLGFIAAVASFIPYFGGMAVNVIAAITAFVISPALFIRTIIAFFVLSILDSYVINPAIYGKTNNIHPLIVIISVFAGGILFGVLGIIISLPVAIILLTTYRFFEKDLYLALSDKKK
ncbi:MAG: AI-2E family transporter [Bacilli bacterium]